MTNNKHRLYTLAGIMGNTLEWYDFALFGYCAPIIARLFFPANEPTVSLLLAYGAFATSFLARPFGGAVFGHIGDTYGRKIALVISISIMTIVTTCIGFLPSYEHIGIAAPILLSICLLIQGFAVSGEFTGAASFMTEHASINSRGVIGSYLFASCYAGKLISSLAISLVSTLVGNQLMLTWGWRIPFVLASIFGIVILALRLKTTETPIFMQALKNKSSSKSPAILAISRHKLSLVTTILLCSLMSVVSYLLVAYLPSFMTTKLGFTIKQTTLITPISLLILTITLPMMGWLSDQIGRKPVMKIGATGFLLFIYPLFVLIGKGTFQSILLGEISMALILAPVAAPIMATLTELYETHVRYSGSVIGYNLSVTFFGGTTPLISIWLVHIFSNNCAPSYYVMIVSLLSLVALQIIPETYHRKLSYSDVAFENL